MLHKVRLHSIYAFLDSSYLREVFQTLTLDYTGMTGWYLPERSKQMNSIWWEDFKPV